MSIAPAAPSTPGRISVGAIPTLVLEVHPRAAGCVDYLIDAVGLTRSDVRTTPNHTTIAIRTRDRQDAARLLGMMRQHIGDELRDAYLSDRFVPASRRHAD